MFAIWVDTWLSGTPVAARKIRNPGQQRGQCKSGTSQQAGEAKKWHFIACDCVIETYIFNLIGRDSLTVKAAMEEHIDRGFSSL